MRRRLSPPSSGAETRVCGASSRTTSHRYVVQLAREGSLSYRSLLLLTSAGVWSYAVGGRAPEMETALLDISFIHSFNYV